MCPQSPVKWGWPGGPAFIYQMRMTRQVLPSSWLWKQNPSQNPSNPTLGLAPSRGCWGKVRVGQLSQGFHGPAPQQEELTPSIQSGISLSLSWNSWKDAGRPLILQRNPPGGLELPGSTGSGLLSRAGLPTPGRKRPALCLDPSFWTSQDLCFCSPVAGPQIRSHLVRGYGALLRITLFWLVSSYQQRAPRLSVVTAQLAGQPAV